ncbi:MAG: phosphoribosylformylglycinamidine synthase subunit PurQ [Candidatus Bipolaricaulia bacterium]
MKRPEALVVTGYGINCEEETAAAYRLAGATATVAHLENVLRGEVSLDGFDIVHLPGGFSFGDDLGGGRVLANRIRTRRLPGGATLCDGLRAVARRGGMVIGICNGFQALVELGLVPNLGGELAAEAALMQNSSGKYEDRWVRVRSDADCPAAVWTGLETWEVPVRHGQGRLVFRDEALREEAARLHLIGLTYCDERGEPAERYPENPNGAELACAALCDPSGRILGIMPHPEAYLSLFNHYDWPRIRRERPGTSEDGAGLVWFRNVVRTVTA